MEQYLRFGLVMGWLAELKTVQPIPFISYCLGQLFNVFQSNFFIFDIEVTSNPKKIFETVVSLLCHCRSR